MKARRWLYLIMGFLGLFLIYLFQDYLDFYAILFEFKAPENLGYASEFKDVEVLPFVVNKTFRYLLNDLFAIAIIYAIFEEKKYVRFAFYVLLFGLLVLLPTYIVVYLLQPEGFSSMLGHLHRVVMNPVLMMLLIPAFFYQRRMAQE